MEPAAWIQHINSLVPDGVSIGFLDIDGLMVINEQAGRDVGDRILQTVSDGLSRWASGIPEAAWVRLRGDEFAFALPGCALEDALLGAETLRQRINASLTDLQTGLPCTLSIGVANAPRDAEDSASLMRVAETACRLAKETEGGRVSLPARDEMVLKSCYYPATSVRRLRQLSERTGRKESDLFREALQRLLASYHPK